MSAKKQGSAGEPYRISLRVLVEPWAEEKFLATALEAGAYGIGRSVDSAIGELVGDLADRVEKQSRFPRAHPLFVADTEGTLLHYASGLTLDLDVSPFLRISPWFTSVEIRGWNLRRTS